MATEQAKGIKKPKDESVPDSGQETATSGTVTDGDEIANLEGYRGPDGSKSLGYLKHPPVGDRSGLGADADDAGRLRQAPGQNSGAGAPTNVEADTTKDREADQAEAKKASKK